MNILWWGYSFFYASLPPSTLSSQLLHNTLDHTHGASFFLFLVCLFFVCSMSFSRLARVELQLVMRCLVVRDLLALAQTCRDAFAAASSNFAWDAGAPVPVALGQRCAPSQHSLLRFARIELRVACDVSYPVVARCRTLVVRTCLFTKRQVCKLYAQPALAVITTLIVECSIGWLPRIRDGPKRAREGVWLRKAARAFSALTELRAQYNGHVKLNRHHDGPFPCLTQLDLQTGFGERIMLTASIPRLHEIYLREFCLNDIPTIVCGAPALKQLHLLQSGTSCLPIVWADLWTSLHGVEFLTLQHHRGVNKVLAELTVHDGHMPALAGVSIAVRQFTHSGNSLNDTEYLWVKLVDTLLARRTQLKLCIRVDPADWFSASEVLARASVLIDLRLIEAQYADRMRVVEV